MVFNVKKDIEKNRLYINIRGKADKAFIQKTFYSVRSLSADLKPGYGVIVDLLECDFIYLDAVLSYKNIIKHLVETKASEIVRIVDKKSTVFGQINNLTKNIQSYNAVHVSSLEEAEEKLDKNLYRNGLRFKIKDLKVRFKYSGENFNLDTVDISKSGCSIKHENMDINIGEIVNIYIVFKGSTDIKSLFQVKSEVVRRDQSAFAVKFIDADADFIETLNNRLAYETCRDE